MKKYLLSLMGLLLMISISTAQITITEIMYNPPETMDDSLEYIELYNHTDANVNLNGYFFSKGVKHTFENTTIDAHAYLVVAKKSAAMMSVLGVPSVQWSSGALKNGGETIELKNPDSTVVDIVTYDDGGDWPGETDGTDGAGASIELCTLDSDNNDGTNWSAADNKTGAIINNIEIIGTPGTENTASCEPPVLTGDFTVVASGPTFTSKDLTITVGQTVLWDNQSGVHNVNGSLATFPSNPEGFFSGDAVVAPWLFNHTFTIPGVYNYQCDPHASIGMTGTITVIAEPQTDYPLYSIGVVNTENSEGVTDSIDVLCALQGIVYGVNLKPNGLQFTIIDENGNGIGCYNGSHNFDYTVQEGDKVETKGKIVQYNGFTQVALDEVSLINSNNALLPATVVTTLSEDTESNLVTLKDVTLVDESKWKDSGSFNVDVTDGTNVNTLRIDGDITINKPTGTFSITGLGGQYDSETPFDSGYQLFPRYQDDIDGESTTPTTNYPLYSIATVTTIDSDGVADSLTVDCTIEGIVYGVNLRPQGLQFTLIDGDGNGIGCFSKDDNFGYNLTEGDLLSLAGNIGQYNGVIQIYLDSLNMISSGNNLVEPSIVTALNESTESSLITIKSVTLVDPSKWKESGNGFNMAITDGTNTYMMRVDNDVVVNKPSGVFDVIGIGGQYDKEAPFDSGYQIFPRYASDLKTISGLEQIDATGIISLSPNPTTEYINVESKVQYHTYKIYDINGTRLMNGSNQTIDVSILNAGVYLIQFQSDHKLYNTKFVKQ